MNTKHPVFIKKFFKKSKIIVNSFHNYCISSKNVSKDLETLAIDNQSNVEMFKHRKFKILRSYVASKKRKNL